ncbi:MAG: YCF48-related protein [Bacteroidota bacterium]|nr:YCF48-related protein [Bacteroidota bacterium]
MTQSDLHAAQCTLNDEDKHLSMGILKTYIAFTAISLLSGVNVSYGQQTENRPIQTQEGVQGWAQQNSGLSSELLGVSFSSKDTGWIATGSLSILLTTNGGKNWTQSIISRGSCHIAALNGQTAVYAACSGENLLFTDDGGANWTPSKIDSAYNIEIVDISFPTPLIGYMLCDNFSILRTEDAGQNWKTYRLGFGPLDFPEFHAINYLDSTNGMIAGSGTILRMFGTGYVMQRDTTVFRGINLFGCELVKQNIEYVVGEEIIPDSATYPAVIVRSTDGGHTWKKTYPNGNSTAEFSGISFPDSLHGTVVGNAGLIYHTANGGETWTKQESGVTTDLNAVNFVDSLTGTAVGSDGVILHTINGGYSWVNPTQRDSLIIQTYPNPATQAINFQYSLPLPQNVSLSLYDIAGRSVAIVLNDSFQSQGDHVLPLNLTSFPNGTYYYRFESEKYFSSGHFTIIH